MFRYSGYRLGKIRATDTNKGEQMTLDEAVEHAEWCAGEARGECAEEHKQLAEWLRELKYIREVEKAEHHMTNAIEVIERLSHALADADAENEKLKKLVRDLHACNGSCLRCLELMGRCEYEEQLGELGIGVLDE